MKFWNCRGNAGLGMMLWGLSLLAMAAVFALAGFSSSAQMKSVGRGVTNVVTGGKVASLEKELQEIEVKLKQLQALTEACAQPLQDYVYVWGFRTGSAELTPSIKRKLDEVIFLVRPGHWTIKVSAGFADTRPWVDEQGRDLNEGLAAQRAYNVAAYLSSALDIQIPYGSCGAAEKSTGSYERDRGVVISLVRSQPT